VILFCAAAGIDHAAVDVLPQATQSMAIRRFIEYDTVGGLATILTRAGFKVVAPKRSPKPRR
jgi:hypothetical protein